MYHYMHKTTKRLRASYVRPEDITDEIGQFNGDTMSEIQVQWNEDRPADKPEIGLNALISLVENWGKDRKITINGNPMTQAIKTLEETHELLEAVNRNNQHEIRDAIGDIIVTLIMQCKLQNMTIEECLYFSFLEIKDRKGELNEVGDFIKEKAE